MVNPTWDTSRVEDVTEHFWSRVDGSGGQDACWPWTGPPMKSGYGQLNLKALGGHVYAHRMAFILFYGPIPDEASVDHECHNRDHSCAGGNSCPHRLCCNPKHLKAKTRGENVKAAYEGRQRGSNITHCPHNHEYTPENTKTTGHGRQCRTCLRKRANEYYARKRAERNS